MAKDDLLDERKVAFLVANEGVEQVELTEPWDAVTSAGATAELVAPEPGEVRGFDGLEPADTFEVDRVVAGARAADYDGMIMPGGVASPDALRLNRVAVAFVRSFFEARKPVAAICHAPWMLIEAGVVKGRSLTSWPSLETDITNAGGRWVDQAVHIDGGLLTSRRPADLEQFCARVVDQMATAPPR